MDLIDKSIDAIFMRDYLGRYIVHPWGILGDGYVITDNVTMNSLKSTYKLHTAFLILISLPLVWLDAFKLLIIFLSLYYVLHGYYIYLNVRNFDVTYVRYTAHYLFIERFAYIENEASYWVWFAFLIFLALISGAILFGYLQSDNRYYEGLAGLSLTGVSLIWHSRVIETIRRKKEESYPDNLK